MSTEKRHPYDGELSDEVLEHVQGGEWNGILINVIYVGRDDDDE